MKQSHCLRADLEPGFYLCSYVLKLQSRVPGPDSDPGAGGPDCRRYAADGYDFRAGIIMTGKTQHTDVDCIGRIPIHAGGSSAPGVFLRCGSRMRALMWRRGTTRD